MSSTRSTPQQGQINPGALRQEDERRRDEARIAALQNQVDELRQTMREVLSRQGREEELLKHYESATAQNRMSIEQLRQETQQSSQARALDENRTRQQINDLDSRLEDMTRPVRSLQAHVVELIEAARTKADDTSQYRQRDDELQVQIEHLSAHVDRTGVLIHQVRDSIDASREETDGLRRDIVRAEDSIKIVDQEARRRVAEVSQSGETIAARIDELRSDLGHLFDLIDDTRRSIVHVDPSLEELREADATVRQEISRVHAQGVERHELLLERVEDMRGDIDARFADVRQAMEQRHERLAERIDDLNEAHRELGFRISQLGGQLDELRLIDASVRRDLWLLNEQRVRLRLDQAQQELDLITAQRRDAETDSGAGRVRRPGDH
jgi:chromosome segregation ATPase